MGTHVDIPTEFFVSNRAAVAESLHGGLIVLSAFQEMQQTTDGAAPFRQEGNFWYLTGIDAPRWQVIIDGVRRKSWLVAPDIDPVHALFDGSLSWDDAKHRSGVDDVLSSDEAMSLLQQAAKQHSVVFTLAEDAALKHASFVVNPAIRSLYRSLDRTFSSVQDCRNDLARLRAIKQPIELRALQKAIDLTVQTFQRVKNTLDARSFEYQIEADFTNAFRQQNAQHAYQPIIASGAHANTLHYIQNDSRLSKRAFVLMDVGARLSGYDADITRTYRVGSAVSKRHEQIHGVVERAHHQIISLIRNGLSVYDYQAQVDEIMKAGLIELGLLHDVKDETTYRKYFPHAISHGLGIDTHDSLGRPDYLQSNMVLTVEPGLYIPEWGIGVRIEDDIQVTETGNNNLSRKLSTSY